MSWTGKGRVCWTWNSRAVVWTRTFVIGTLKMDKVKDYLPKVYSLNL